MAELRLVGVSEDGERLVLTDDDGVRAHDRHRRTASGRSQRPPLAARPAHDGTGEPHLPARDPEQSAQRRVGRACRESAGVPLERVLRFVGPVLREREHIADQARRARLAGTNGPTSLLGDLVTRAANRRDVDPDDVDWDSARREDQTWVVTTTWPDGTTAMWALDLSAPPSHPARRRRPPDQRHPSTKRLDDSARRRRGFPDIANSPDFARFDANQTDAVRLESDADTGAKVHQFVPRSVPTASRRPAAR